MSGYVVLGVTSFALSMIKHAASSPSEIADLHPLTVPMVALVESLRGVLLVLFRCFVAVIGDFRCFFGFGDVFFGSSTFFTIFSTPTFLEASVSQ